MRSVRRFTDNCLYGRLVLGLLDCALVNAYIVHKETRKRQKKKPMRHGECLAVLHGQMINVQSTQLNDRPVRAIVIFLV
jgi:hypothetical protein